MIISSRLRGQGYLLNDNRESGGAKFEMDVWCCPHCQAVLQKKENYLDHWCPRCFSPICILCAKKMETEGCVPFMKKIEKEVEAHYRRKQFAKAVGLEG